MTIDSQLPSGRGKRSTLTEKVSIAIREKIMSGEFEAGEKLPREKDLVADFAVSRTVVREALAKLSADGLIEIRHGVGVFALDPAQRVERNPFLSENFTKISAVLDLFELRRGIEIEAAGLAALRRSPAQEARIREAYHSLKAALDKGEVAASNDLELHRTIAEATNNRFYTEFLDFLTDQAIGRTVKGGYGGDEAQRLDKMTHLQDEHREIVEAIGAQDSERAREAMRSHLMNSEKRFRALSMREL
ncbi:FadR/GntR family transcriptional regulator [Denitrobaculum tricleocarpae]|uniref:FadR family transcriptional regulator n=1 Tax=Denitrobaculum tricleocarpae TaxID=2591009 RepID=A0A545TYC1_9PROT|nr:FadR/GntR family transcriptional regulator [Denitrobaculum tricleocarpae]TQV82226.1 FadR family transcriptional regulator [Denitrobaculum tricleocarpae]